MKTQSANLVCLSAKVHLVKADTTPIGAFLVCKLPWGNPEETATLFLTPIIAGKQVRGWTTRSPVDSRVEPTAYLKQLGYAGRVAGVRDALLLVLPAKKRFILAAVLNSTGSACEAWIAEGEDFRVSWNVQPMPPAYFNSLKMTLEV